MPRARAGETPLAGMVLAHDVRGPDGSRAFEKGQALGPGDVPVLLELSWNELHLIEPEPGDVHEGEAGRRIAVAAAGEGAEVGELAGGHWPLVACVRGMLAVDVDRLQRVNGVEGVAVYTLYDGQIVDAGEIVARAKITPFVLSRTRVEEAERLARGDGSTSAVACVRAFRAAVVGAVVQETLGERAMARFREALCEKITWLGSRLLEPRFVQPDAGAVAASIRTLAAEGAAVIVMAGAKAMDPLDPAFLALEQLGAPIDRLGVPAHPGSLLWLAHVGTIPVLGMPTCGLFSQATTFDLVLPRLLAGERLGVGELAALGHGGLLTRDAAFRFPRYRTATGRGEVE